MKTLIACAFAIASTATGAFAQQGAFTLPVRVHWGMAVLEPGAHSLKPPSAAKGPIFYISGDEGIEMSIPSSTENIEQSERSYLRLVKVNGDYFVNEFYSGLSGKKYHFATPKGTRPTVLADIPVRHPTT